MEPAEIVVMLVVPLAQRHPPRHEPSLQQKDVAEL
jgi:hypothetical protein